MISCHARRAASRNQGHIPNFCYKLDCEWHNPRMGQRKSPIRRILRWMCAAGLLWLLGSVLLVLVLRFAAPPTSAFMLHRQLRAVIDKEANFQLHRCWRPLNQISANLPIAVVAAEDQNFPEHHGFDIKAIKNALAEAEDGERLRGASTISQQVAKNLFLWNGRSFIRKGFEAWFTALIEFMWPKQRILEVYVNIAEFGDGVYGACAASERFFGKPASRLSPREAALLAAVLPNPVRLRADRPSAYVQRRATWIERQVRQLGGPDYLKRFSAGSRSLNQQLNAIVMRSSSP
jgi:monofunctional biosynthetic peptidoglycan transglycosylase